MPGGESAETVLPTRCRKWGQSTAITAQLSEHSRWFYWSWGNPSGWNSCLMWRETAWGLRSRSHSHLNGRGPPVPLVRRAEGTDQTPKTMEFSDERSRETAGNLPGGLRDPPQARCCFPRKTGGHIRSSNAGIVAEPSAPIRYRARPATDPGSATLRKAQGFDQATGLPPPLAIAVPDPWGPQLLRGTYSPNPYSAVGQAALTVRWVLYTGATSW